MKQISAGAPRLGDRLWIEETSDCHSRLIAGAVSQLKTGDYCALIVPDPRSSVFIRRSVTDEHLDGDTRHRSPFVRHDDPARPQCNGTRTRMYRERRTNVRS